MCVKTQTANKLFPSTVIFFFSISISKSDGLSSELVGWNLFGILILNHFYIKMLKHYIKIFSRFSKLSLFVILVKQVISCIVNINLRNCIGFCKKKTTESQYIYSMGSSLWCETCWMKGLDTRVKHDHLQSKILVVFCYSLMKCGNIFLVCKSRTCISLFWLKGHSYFLFSVTLKLLNLVAVSHHVTDFYD